MATICFGSPPPIPMVLTAPANANLLELPQLDGKAQEDGEDTEILHMGKQTVLRLHSGWVGACIFA